MSYKPTTDYQQRQAVVDVMRQHNGEVGKQVVDDLHNAESQLAASQAECERLRRKRRETSHENISVKKIDSHLHLSDIRI